MTEGWTKFFNLLGAKLFPNPVPEEVPKKVEPPQAVAEEPLRFFTPNYDFHSPELKSHYLKGLTYTIRPGKSYDLLRSLADGEWSRRGIIRFLPAHSGSPGNIGASRAVILGTATVKDK